LCPDKSNPDDSRVRCVCQSGYYQIPRFTATGPLLSIGQPNNSSTVTAQHADDDLVFNPESNAFEFAWECRACPQGADCTEADTHIDTVVPLSGFYPEVGGSNESFLECLSPACVGGERLCATGYGGPLCTVCDPGYTRSGRLGCKKCPDPSVNRLRTVGGVIGGMVLVCVIVLSTLSGSPDNKPRHSVAIKVLVASCQFNSLAVSFDYDWPPFVAGLLYMQEDVVTSGTAFFSLGCLSLENSISTLHLTSILYLVVPLLMLGRNDLLSLFAGFC
jgi:hypothetical protein